MWPTIVYQTRACTLLTCTLMCIINMIKELLSVKRQQFKLSSSYCSENYTIHTSLFRCLFWVCILVAVLLCGACCVH